MQEVPHSCQKTPSDPETHPSSKSIVHKGHSEGRDGLEGRGETTPYRDPSTIKDSLSLLTRITKLIYEPPVRGDCSIQGA